MQRERGNTQTALNDQSVLVQYSLSQSNKGENGDVVAYTNNEDEPQGEGEIFHVFQLDHLPCTTLADIKKGSEEALLSQSRLNRPQSAVRNHTAVAVQKPKRQSHNVDLKTDNKNTARVLYSPT